MARRKTKGMEENRAAVGPKGVVTTEDLDAVLQRVKRVETALKSLGDRVADIREKVEELKAKISR